MQWKPGNSVPITAFEVEQDRYVGRVNTRNGKITAMIGLKRGVAVAIHHKKGLHKNGVEARLSRSDPLKLHYNEIISIADIMHQISGQIILGTYRLGQLAQGHFR